MNNNTTGGDSPQGTEKGRKLGITYWGSLSEDALVIAMMGGIKDVDKDAHILISPPPQEATPSTGEKLYRWVKDGRLPKVSGEYFVVTIHENDAPDDEKSKDVVEYIAEKNLWCMAPGWKVVEYLEELPSPTESRELGELEIRKSLLRRIDVLESELAASKPIPESRGDGKDKGVEGDLLTKEKILDSLTRNLSYDCDKIVTWEMALAAMEEYANLKASTPTQETAVDVKEAAGIRNSIELQIRSAFMVKEHTKKPTESIMQDLMANIFQLLAGAAYKSDAGWISVDAKLPKLDEQVLVWGLPTNPQPQMGGIKPKVSITARFDPKGTMIDNSRERERLLDKNNFRLIKVTHWQHLPTPPQSKTINL